MSNCVIHRVRDLTRCRELFDTAGSVRNYLSSHVNFSRNFPWLCFSSIFHMNKCYIEKEIENMENYRKYEKISGVYLNIFSSIFKNEF